MNRPHAVIGTDLDNESRYMPRGEAHNSMTDNTIYPGPTLAPCDALPSQPASSLCEQRDETQEGAAFGGVSATDRATRRCPRCEREKPAAEFGTRVKRGRVEPQAYCRACMVAYHKEWRSTPQGGAKFAAKSRESKQRYPERERARNALSYAIRLGRVERGDCYAACPECAGKIEAHHDDYSRPLDVVWTCRAHHRPLDRARQQRRAA